MPRIKLIDNQMAAAPRRLPQSYELLPTAEEGRGSVGGCVGSAAKVRTNPHYCGSLYGDK